MIRERNGEFYAICSNPGCGVTESADAVDFKDFVAHIKKLGWVVRKGLNWEHYCCSNCAGDV